MALVLSRRERMQGKADAEVVMYIWIVVLEATYSKQFRESQPLRFVGISQCHPFPSESQPPSS